MLELYPVHWILNDPVSWTIWYDPGYLLKMRMREIIPRDPIRLRVWHGYRIVQDQADRIAQYNQWAHGLTRAKDNLWTIHFEKVKLWSFPLICDSTKRVQLTISIDIHNSRWSDFDPRVKLWDDEILIRGWVFHWAGSKDWKKKKNPWGCSGLIRLWARHPSLVLHEH